MCIWTVSEHCCVEHHLVGYVSRYTDLVRCVLFPVAVGQGYLICIPRDQQSCQACQDQHSQASEGCPPGFNPPCRSQVYCLVPEATLFRVMPMGPEAFLELPGMSGLSLRQHDTAMHRSSDSHDDSDTLQYMALRELLIHITAGKQHLLIFETHHSNENTLAVILYILTQTKIILLYYDNCKSTYKKNPKIHGRGESKFTIFFLSDYFLMSSLKSGFICLHPHTHSISNQTYTPLTCAFTHMCACTYILTKNWSLPSATHQRDDNTNTIDNMHI